MRSLKTELPVSEGTVYAGQMSWPCLRRGEGERAFQARRVSLGESVAKTRLAVPAEASWTAKIH